jgi:hypothetical protein
MIQNILRKKTAAAILNLKDSLQRTLNFYNNYFNYTCGTAAF